jgi:hypothetical protein
MTTATATAAGDPAAPCAGRAYLTRREAERAWVRARALDPAGTVELVVRWCDRCWAFHLGRRPKSTGGRQP